MDGEKIKNSEIIQLTKKFAEAVKNRDKKTIKEIINDNLKIETKIIGKRSFQDFDVNKLNEVLVIVNWEKTKTFLYEKRNEVQAVFEINSHWHLKGTAFQSGFIRQTFTFGRFSGSWKLKHLKNEFSRFSKYNLKESISGFITWLLIKTYKING